MAVKFLNYTPHLFVMRDMKIPSSGVARATQEDVVTASTKIGGILVDTVDRKFGEVTGLPAPEAGTWIIVSRIAAEASKAHAVAARMVPRNDLLVPDRLVRDAAGNVIGCERLVRIA